MKQNFVDKTEEYYSYSRQEMLEYVAQNVSKVLDVGCSKGYFGRALKEKYPQAEIHGIEMCKDYASEAEKNIDKVINFSVEVAINDLQDGFYNHLIFNDVLEHLSDPVDVLKQLKPKLTPDCIIIASIPNIRYFDVIYDLIVNKDWAYKNAGILDYTHLRFFTEKSIPAFFESAGYELVFIKGLNKNRFGIFFKILNFLTGGHMSDMRFLQYACVAKIKQDN